MGTDIHAVFQRRIPQTNEWVDIKSEFEENRHYMLFAWLGDVRNGFGFAGAPTHDPIVPLAPRRGFPPDFNVVDECHHPFAADLWSSGHIKRYAEYGWEEEPNKFMGDHSHSWALAQEILDAAPWIVDTVRRGVVPLEFYLKWDGVSQPDNWCADIFGGAVVKSTPDTMTMETTHVQIEWKVDDLIGEEFKYFIDEVQRLQDLHGEVRMVFGFDS